MLPRPVLPRQFYLVTRRCAQRQFLLCPDAATNNAFLYCLIAAALRSEIDVLLPCAMSNLEAIIDSRGRAITTSASNVARMGWKSSGIPGAMIAACAVDLPRKGVIVSLRVSPPSAMDARAAV